MLPVDSQASSCRGQRCQKVVMDSSVQHKLWISWRIEDGIRLNFPRSRAYYRVNAVRNITASGKGKTVAGKDSKDNVVELAKIRGQVDELIDNDNGEGQTQACADTRAWRSF